MEQQLESDGHKSVSSDQTMTYIENLEPYTMYRINISAKFLDGSWGTVNTVYARTDVDGEHSTELYFILIICFVLYLPIYNVGKSYFCIPVLM